MFFDWKQTNMKRYWRYFKVKANEVYDAFLFFMHVPPKQVKVINQSVNRTILFIGQKSDPRIPRLTKWINRSKEYSTVILCHNDGFTREYVTKEQGTLVFYRNEWHLRRIISGINVYLIHGYAPLSRFPSVALKEAKRRKKNIPFIMDYQDVYVLYYGVDPKNTVSWLKDDLRFEKYCYNNADGLIACSMEPFWGNKLWGGKKISSRLFFPLYADNNVFTLNKTKITSDEIHLVYIGGIYSASGDSTFGGIAQLHWLIDFLRPQKIHFHIYPRPGIPKLEIMEYEKIATENEYFHMHESVSQADLSKELSQYHYGLIPFFKGTSAFNDGKFKYAATLKIFNYMEAGIPVLTSRDYEFQAWMTERYNLGIVLDGKDDFKDLSNKIYSKPYGQQVEELLKGREKLSLQLQHKRLLKFYDSFNKSNGS